MFTSTGACGNCMVADPLFADASASDLDLTSASPAIDAAFEHPVYATFAGLYGLDIRVDFDGVPRPQNLTVDIGACEFGE